MHMFLAFVCHTLESLQTKFNIVHINELSLNISYTRQQLYNKEIERERDREREVRKRKRERVCYSWTNMQCKVKVAHTFLKLHIWHLSAPTSFSLDLQGSSSQLVPFKLRSTTEQFPMTTQIGRLWNITDISFVYLLCELIAQQQSLNTLIVYVFAQTTSLPEYVGHLHCCVFIKARIGGMKLHELPWVIGSLHKR